MVYVVLLSVDFKLPVPIAVHAFSSSVTPTLSGYLISTILLSNISAEKDRLIYDFWCRRVFRLLPALFCMLAVVLIAGHWAFLSDQYSALAQQTFYTLFTGANVLFLNQAKGYFFSELEFPLLHCWSLAVEEQYYLVYPLLLTIAWKVKPHRATMFGVLVFIFAASFIASIVITPHDQSFAFYLLPCRAWEVKPHRATMFGVLVFIAVASFIASTVVAPHDPSFAFYLLPRL
jgi:peptidoglycan/LPS O-acetylase OafA/YrhL